MVAEPSRWMLHSLLTLSRKGQEGGPALKKGRSFYRNFPRLPVKRNIYFEGREACFHSIHVLVARNGLKLLLELISFVFFCSSSGASVVAIDNKIEQAMVSFIFFSLPFLNCGALQGLCIDSLCKREDIGDFVIGLVNIPYCILLTLDTF